MQVKTTVSNTITEEVTVNLELPYHCVLKDIAGSNFYRVESEKSVIKVCCYCNDKNAVLLNSTFDVFQEGVLQSKQITEAEWWAEYNKALSILQPKDILETV